MVSFMSLERDTKNYYSTIKGMKVMKKTIAIIFCICIYMCLLTSVAAENYIIEEAVSPLIAPDDAIAFSAIANERYQKLFKAWDEKYPDYYGGAYIDGSKLYILVTCEPEDVQTEINQIVGADICAITKVENSYNKLVAVYKELNNRFQNLEITELVELITGWRVSEKENCIIVTVCSKATMDTEIYGCLGYGDDIIKIEYVSSHNVPCSINVVAGYKDWVWSGGVQSTIGFCAERQNSQGVYEKGFVLAGHAAGLYDEVTINNTVVGVVSYSQLSGNCDAAFVNMNDIDSDYVRSTILSSTYRIDRYISVGIVGSTYQSHGMETGIQCGTLDSTLASLYYHYDDRPSVLLADMIGMVIGVNEGDSGGPLVMPISGTNSTAILGTLSGIRINDNYAYYTKFTSIADQLDLMLY